MDHLHAYKRRVQLIGFGIVVLVGLLTALTYYLGLQLFGDDSWLVYLMVGALGLAQAGLLAWKFADYATQPLEFIWQAVVHVTPNGGGLPAPNLDEARVAHELVSNLVLQIYQLASNTAKISEASTASHSQSANLTELIANNLPLPLLAVDSKQTIVFVNEAALKYLGLERKAVLQANIYSVLDLAFTDENTLDRWLQDCRANKATADQAWRRVRLTLADQKTTHQFDMAAHYSKSTGEGSPETIITIFDQTAQYLADDHALDFMALAVHELRTPLTVLRGYIEVFEDELSTRLDPEYQSLLHQLHASALQLTAFVNNILNVARIQEGQLSLQLTEESWADIIKNAVADLSLQAQVYGKIVDFTVEGNVPPVAVDKISITEVINNLVDNALKYSGKSQKISIHAYVGQDGMVETTVQDWGVGIPASVLPHLFEKFRRNYHNQAQIGGTGLGLYLSSELVKAHGGNIWVKSKDNEGTVVGFTLQPYQQLAESLKNSNNKDIVRTAHGWIKNHSLYRR